MKANTLQETNTKTLSSYQVLKTKTCDITHLFCNLPPWCQMVIQFVNTKYINHFMPCISSSVLVSSMQTDRKKWGRQPNQPNSTNQPAPWSRVFLEKLIVTQLVEKFPAFYGAPRFITKFIGAHHWSLP